MKSFQHLFIGAALVSSFTACQARDRAAEPTYKSSVPDETSPPVTTTAPKEDPMAPHPGGTLPIAPSADVSDVEPPDEAATRVRREIEQDRALTGVPGLEVLVEDGLVTLRGTVATEAQREAAKRRAAAIAGDDNVKDELRVTGATTP